MLSIVATVLLASVGCSDASSVAPVPEATSSDIVRLSVTPRVTQHVLGDSVMFVAYAHYANGDSVVTPVTWTASSGSISSKGAYRAKRAGRDTVSATGQPGLTDTATVTVVDTTGGASPTRTLSRVVLAPAAVTLAPGATAQFAATGTWSDGTTGALGVTYVGAGGTITPGGLYTAGTVAGTYNVIATQAGGLLADTSKVTISTPPPTTTAAATLRSLASARGFAIGAAVRDSAFSKDAQYRQTLATQFNSIVPEDATDFWPIHPGPTQYDFAASDALVAFAQANGMAFHGHHLAWYSWIPTWVTNGGYTNAQLMGILKDHITTVVGHFRGKAASWDVVNEVIDDQSCFNGTCTMRQSFWLTHLGAAYIDSSFVWAHRADPAAKLYINDFRTETANNKADAVLALATALKGRGVPIDGVGFQTHILMQYFGVPTSAALQANFQRFANAGFDLRITEMDVAIPDAGGAQDLATQATVYGNVLDACLKVTRCKELTLWGMSDKYSWIASSFPGYGRPLPFDNSYQPKPAFNALLTRMGQP